MSPSTKLAPLFLTAFLAACGGGGGGGDSGTPTAQPAAITSSNYTTVGRESSAATMGMVDLAVDYNFLAGASVATEPAWVAFGLAQWRALAPHFGGQRATVAGVTITETLPCNGGGSITYVINDVNGDDQADAGDSVGATFNSCGIAGAAVTGGLTIHISSQPSGDLGGAAYSAGLTMVFDNLRAVSGSSTSTASGDLSVQTERTALSVGSDVITARRFTSAFAVGSTTRSRTVSDFSATVTFASTQSTTRFSGTVASSELGNQSVQTGSTTDFLRLFSEPYPRQGVAVVIGANGGKASLSVVDATTVTLAVDANGDGTSEQSTQVLWTSLL